MAAALGASLSRLRGNLSLNLLIVVLIVADVTAGLAVIDQRSGLDEAPPIPQLVQPVRSSSAGAPSQSTVGRELLEQLQSSIVVAQALELQKGGAVSAQDLSTALAGITFVNGFTAVEQGIVGVASSDAGILLLTQDASGAWACAAADRSGRTGLGRAEDRAALETVPGCLAVAG